MPAASCWRKMRRSVVAAVAVFLSCCISLAEAQEPSSIVGSSPLYGLSGATGWINSPPLNAKQLKGKVVLVDFWTYSCINCLRSVPYVRAWAEKYKDSGLVVIGVHTPEFDFEKQLPNVQKAVQKFAIPYPVGSSSNFAIWNAFHNRVLAGPLLHRCNRQGPLRALRRGGIQPVWRWISSYCKRRTQHTCHPPPRRFMARASRLPQTKATSALPRPTSAMRAPKTLRRQAGSNATPTSSTRSHHLFA